ncbi:protein TIFY 9-like [Diospyros lotus]|uniref:protein TIFY 9-like n=1 Tax=Diospyros lotus TaxID=55363 RepID=UPI0022581C38|nr:protein TIFY 9-like [Diospyros lotus]
MAKSSLELDFFPVEKVDSAKPQTRKLFDRRRSFRDIQSVISKLNPDLLKTVIASGSADQSSGFSKPSESANSSPPKHDENLNMFAALPVYTPTFGSIAYGSESASETSPLTILYNGTVAVFDVPPHKAENILKFAEGGLSKTVQLADPKLEMSSESLSGDLPIARRKSLQRFLEKRKQRLALACPYGVLEHTMTKA